MEDRVRDKWWPAPVLAWAGYVLLLFLLTWKHAFWRDETEVWLVARASRSLSELFHNIRYEGHPPLWYLVQWGLTRFTSNVEWMKVPNFLFAVVAAWMVLGARRLPLWVRLGIVFSYCMVFEYGLIARNYMIGIILLVAVARTMMRPGRQSVAVPFLLALAALTSLPGLVVATGMAVLSLWFVWRDQGRVGFLGVRGAGRLAGALVYCVCAFVAVATIRPPADSGLLLETKPPQMGVVTRVAVAGQLFTKAYVPVPQLQAKFWNTLLVSRIGNRAEDVLGLLLIAALTFFFRSTPVRCFFAATSTVEVAQMIYSGRAMDRHLGWLFVIFVLSLLQDGSSESEIESEGVRGWRLGMLAGLLACQVAAAGVAVSYSFRYPFATSRQVAKFLVDRHLDQATLAFEPFFVGQSVMAYLPGSTGYSLEEHQSWPFVVWDREEFVTRRPFPSLAELQAASKDGVQAVLITEAPLSAEDSAKLKVKLLGAFEDAICHFDIYYVYR